LVYTHFNICFNDTLYDENYNFILSVYVYQFDFRWEYRTFSMVIIASLMIDNFVFEEDFSAFLDKKNDSEPSILIKRFLVFIFPLLMVMFCLIAYMGCINMSEEKIDMFVVAIELSTFIAIAAYAAHIKQLSWDKKKNSLTNKNKMINSH